RKHIYSYALKIVKSEIFAEEILHDVFMKIWHHENAAEIDNLEYYLKTITRNITFNVLRRIKLEVRVNHELSYSWAEMHNETEEAIIGNEASKLLHQGIDLLPPQQKLVYILCRDEGLKYAQVAERLSISPLTVKTHMQQALRFLRNYVSKHSDLSMFVILLQIISEKK
ncbi:MAG: sigma-70 family RNA polymerase sigma factor, partial [Pedobacter sp.]|nr:sigma-70 family RNA polymerase sigma factor [Pedobacter sp.]